MSIATLSIPCDLSEARKRERAVAGLVMDKPAPPTSDTETQEINRLVREEIEFEHKLLDIKLRLAALKMKGQNHAQLIAISRRMEKAQWFQRQSGLGNFITSAGPTIQSKSMKRRLKAKAKAKQQESIQKETPTTEQLQVRSSNTPQKPSKRVRHEAIPD